MSMVSIPQDGPPRLTLIHTRPMALSAETQREISPIRRQLVMTTIAQHLCDLDRAERRLPLAEVTRLPLEERQTYEHAAGRVVSEVVDKAKRELSEAAATMVAYENFYPSYRPIPARVMAFHRAAGQAIHYYREAMRGFNPAQIAHLARRWRHELAMATDREEGR